jgi:hypothetical protein
MHPTEKEPNRQAVLLAGAPAGTTAALGAVGVLGASPASAATVAPGVPQAPVSGRRYRHLALHLWVPKSHATRRYSWMTRPARSCRWTRK